MESYIKQTQIENNRNIKAKGDAVMRQVYLDYSATTPVKEDVWKAMLPYYTDFYGNPSSLYSVGLEAKAGLDKARGQVADLINAEPRRCV